MSVETNSYKSSIVILINTYFDYAIWLYKQNFFEQVPFFSRLSTKTPSSCVIHNPKLFFSIQIKREGTIIATISINMVRKGKWTEYKKKANDRSLICVLYIHMYTYTYICTKDSDFFSSSFSLRCIDPIHDCIRSTRTCLPSFLPGRFLFLFLVFFSLSLFALFLCTLVYLLVKTNSFIVQF